MAARKKTSRATRVTPRKKPVQKTGLSEYFRFGESYTILILGIVVVIIASILLVSFIKNKNIGNNIGKAGQQIMSQQTRQSLTNTATPSAMAQALTSTPEPTQVVTPTTSIPTIRPTLVPTHAMRSTFKPTLKPTLLPTVTAIPTMTMSEQNKIPAHLPGTYNVQSGDSLWTIAEKEYGSGYNWLDIAKANNLSNPDVLYAGTKLQLPRVPTRQITVVAQAQISIPNRITGSTYTVIHGDNLWDIAVRAYGDGYQWTKIAQANHLANPRLIFSGNVFIIPRN